MAGDAIRLNMGVVDLLLLQREGAGEWDVGVGWAG